MSHRAWPARENSWSSLVEEMLNLRSHTGQEDKNREHWCDLEKVGRKR